MQKVKLILLPFASGFILFAAWEYCSRNGYIDPFLLPSPSAMVFTLFNQFELVATHASISFRAILIGFFGGMLFASAIAILTVSSQTIRLMIEPLLIISQAIPKVALAPIFLIALGSGIESRALISALICFFPFYANLTQGLTSVSPELLLQARLADKSRMQVLLFIRCIFAIPYFVTAARSAILLSVIGVVVGEFVGANNGLGYLILDSSARFNIDLMFACILALSIIGGSLYVCVSLLGKKMINMTRLGK